jgi:hypothetical protein
MIVSFRSVASKVKFQFNQIRAFATGQSANGLKNQGVRSALGAAGDVETRPSIKVFWRHLAARICGA